MIKSMEQYKKTLDINSDEYKNISDQLIKFNDYEVNLKKVIHSRRWKITGIVILSAIFIPGILNSIFGVFKKVNNTARSLYHSNY